MDKKMKIGRPAVSPKNKKMTRTVTTDFAIEEYLSNHPEISASKLFKQAVRSQIPNDPAEVQLEKLKEELGKLEKRRNEIYPEIERLEKNIEDKKRIKLQLKLEEDYEAWYLRYLVDHGIFKTIYIKETSVEPVLESMIKRKDITREDIVEKHGKLFINISTKNSTMVYRRLTSKGFMDPNTHELHSIPGHYEFNTLPDDLQVKYHVKIDYEKFKEDFSTEKISSDMPVSFFKEYNPRVLSTWDDSSKKYVSNLKEEIQKMMVQEYQAMAVDVERGDVTLEK